MTKPSAPIRRPLVTPRHLLRAVYVLRKLLNLICAYVDGCLRNPTHKIDRSMKSSAFDAVRSRWEDQRSDRERYNARGSSDPRRPSVHRHIKSAHENRHAMRWRWRDGKRTLSSCMPMTQAPFALARHMPPGPCSRTRRRWVCTKRWVSERDGDWTVSTATQGSAGWNEKRGA